MHNQHPRTDIQFNGRLLRHAPTWLKPYIMVMRMDRPVGTLLLLWPCYWSLFMASGGVMQMDSYVLGLVLLFTIGSFLMRSAGCVINDIWDRNLDKKVERTSLRPLASGALSVQKALVLLAALLLTSLGILLSLHITAILLGLLAFCLVVIYPAMKRVTYWPQIFLGLTFNFGTLMGWAAIEGRVSMAALFLYIAGLFWTLGYDTIYAYQDKEDDALIGVKSTARLFGEKGKLWVSIFYGISLLLFLGAGIWANVGPLFYIISVISYAYLFWHVKNWQMNVPENCLKCFKLNMLFGFFLALACATL